MSALREVSVYVCTDVEDNLKSIWKGLNQLPWF